MSNKQILSAFQLETAKRKQDYFWLPQGNETNSFFTTTAKKANDIDEAGLYTYTNGDFLMFVEGFDLFQQRITYSSKRVLVQMLIKHNENKNSFTLREYMNLCGLTDTKEARKSLVYDVNLLWNTSIRFKNGDKIRLLGKTNEKELYSRGTVNFALSAEFREWLADPKKSFWAYYPLSILQLPELAGKIAFKLIAHYAMNAAKKNANYISTKTLMEAAQLNEENIKPSKTGGKPLKQRIIDPIEKALETLESVGILREFYLMGPRKTRLTDDELVSYNFRDWENYSYFFALNLPEEYLKNRQEAIKQQKRIAQQKGGKK